MDGHARAERLANALLYPQISNTPPIWRGTCPTCRRESMEISTIDTIDGVSMMCMACGIDGNWRKIEHDLFDVPAFDLAPVPIDIGLVLPLNDPAWWSGEAVTSAEWLAEPLIPAARSIALYAPAKAGKSITLLAVCTALATARPVFGTHPLSARSGVLYLDFEMTESDVLERLENMGFGADDQLADFLSYVLPTMPPLDTPEGGAELVRWAQVLGVALVVIDTFGRAVKGDENSVETVRDFYRYTGHPLKMAGIACLRADHSGKNLDLGQRGTSGKNDDVDVVWQLTRTDTGVVIKRTHSRLSWVPPEIVLDYREDEYGGVTIDAGLAAVPAGTNDMIKLLDEIGVDSSASARAAARELRAHGRKGTTAVINAAQRTRRDRIAHAFALVSPNVVDNPAKVIRIAESIPPPSVRRIKAESLERHPSSEPYESTTNQPESPAGTDDASLVMTEGNHHQHESLSTSVDLGDLY